MPKSKRSKVVSLTQTEKKGRVAKENLVQQIRDAVDTYRYVWTFTIDNMRNTYLKEIREHWKATAETTESDLKAGRFFMGKNKVMAKALGTSAEEEYQLDLHRLAEKVTGNVGLFFTNAPKEQVLSYFREYERTDYARGGSVATETVVLPEGPLMLGEIPFPNSMESQLRQLGVPSLLKNGIVQLQGDFTICKEGQVLSFDQARLLKMFQISMAVFRVRLTGVWSAAQEEDANAGSTFEDLEQDFMEQVAR